MAITAVLTVQAKSGRHQEVVKGLREMQELEHQQGQTSRLIRPVTGEHQGAVSLVTEYSDWAAFGAAAEKIRASTGYQQIVERARQTADSPVESLSTNFYTDIE